MIGSLLSTQINFSVMYDTNKWHIAPGETKEATDKFL